MVEENWRRCHGYKELKEVRVGVRSADGVGGEGEKRWRGRVKVI